MMCYLSPEPIVGLSIYYNITEAAVLVEPWNTREGILLSQVYTGKF